MRSVVEPGRLDVGALFEQHGDRVFGFLLARAGTRSVAEDLTAETFLDAARHIDRGHGQELTVGWLITVARRRLVDHWRTMDAKRRRFDRLAAEVDRTQRLATDVDPVTDSADVDAALASLSTIYRAALVLRYVDDFSVSEVADALGRTYKATESLLGRARDAFATAFEELSC